MKLSRRQVPQLFALVDELRTKLQSKQHDASGSVNGSLVLFNRFLEWYWPSFNAYSFILARMDEYEADRCAAQLAGAHSTAEALINLEVKARFLESCFWSNIQKQVEHQADPPGNTYSSMLTVLGRHKQSSQVSRVWEPA